MEASKPESLNEDISYLDMCRNIKGQQAPYEQPFHEHSGNPLQHAECENERQG